MDVSDSFRMGCGVMGWGYFTEKDAGNVVPFIVPTYTKVRG